MAKKQNETAGQPVPGTSVWEAAMRRIEAIDREISSLQAERRQAVRRLKDEKNRFVSEAERRAAAAEPFQKTPLPKYKEGYDTVSGEPLNQDEQRDNQLSNPV